MELLSAVSLAGNILQLVQITTSLLSPARQISKAGAPKDVQDWANRLTPPESQSTTQDL